MTLKDTVRDILLTCPSSNQNAIEAYEHLFCVIGNGYHWEDGELVSSENNPILTIKDAVINILNTYLIENISLLEDAFEDCGTIKYIFPAIINSINSIFEIDKIENDFTIIPYEDFPRSFYPLSDYSAMVNFPDDIKPDWLEGIKKMITLMEENPKCVNESDWKYIEQIKERIMKYEHN